MQPEVSNGRIDEQGIRRIGAVLIPTGIPPVLVPIVHVVAGRRTAVKDLAVVVLEVKVVVHAGDPGVPAADVDTAGSEGVRAGRTMDGVFCLLPEISAAGG